MASAECLSGLEYSVSFVILFQFDEVIHLMPHGSIHKRPHTITNVLTIVAK